MPLFDTAEARVRADATLIEADDMLLRLHESCGGAPGGVLAVPALADLVRACARLGMRLSRPVRAAGAEDDVEMWVETIPDSDDVRVRITDWRLTPRADDSGNAQLQRLRAADIAAVAGDAMIQIDSALRIVATRGFSAEAADAIGNPITDYCTLLPAADGVLPMLRAVAERQPFADQVAAHGEGMVSLSGRPLADSHGVFAGYLIDITSLPPPEGVTDLADPQQAPPALIARLAPALRQPLGRIIAKADTIGERLAGPLRESYATYSRDIASAARHLLEIIEDVSDLDAIERPDFSTAAEAVDLADCARRVAGLLSMRAMARSIRIIAPDGSVSVTATGEFRRVLQILVNLVSNALRYADEGGEVRIEVARDGERARLHVIDNGPGVALADRDRIFDKFERLGRKDEAGSGLGLYISRKLARTMSGDVAIDIAPGGGAKFTLDLPLCAAEAALPQRSASGT